MMKAMGIIFANIYDSSLGDLTNKRTIASLPYGGRYRQIDFTLSNMSNSGIRHIGNNHQIQLPVSDEPHRLRSGVGPGPGRRRHGISDPLCPGPQRRYRGKLEALNSAMVFLENSLEDYVILADSSVLCNIDLEKVLEYHVSSGKDITAVMKAGIANGTKQLDLGIRLSEDGQVADMAVDYCAGQNIWPAWASSSSIGSCSSTLSRSPLPGAAIALSGTSF